MKQPLLNIAKKFWPALETMGQEEKIRRMYDIFGVLYSMPLALAGLVWLIFVSDWSLILRSWPFFLLLAALVFIIKKFDFFFFFEVRPGVFSYNASSFEGIITWSAALIFGPTVLWLAVLGAVIDFIQPWHRAESGKVRWNAVRNFAQNLAAASIISLTALMIYKNLGGVFPLPGLTFDAVWPAFLATLIHFLFSVLLHAPLVMYVAKKTKEQPSFSRRVDWVRVIAIGLIAIIASTLLVELYAILAAGLYIQNNPWVYFFFISGVLIMSLLTYRLSQTVERSQQRSRELAKLEELGRAIFAAPPDCSTLPELLQEHASTMFSRSQIEIRMGRSLLFADQTILHDPDDWPPVEMPVWEWGENNPEAQHFAPRSSLPWGGRLSAETAIVLVPILDIENSEVIGGIHLSRRWDPAAIAQSLPAVQSLAAQIASALHRAEIYRIEQEMAVAGKIQASFLPDSTQQFADWQITATLEAARECSGDFYDLIPLPEGRLGIVIADVADKGTGAALYMAASRTLIRTYAVEHDTHPELALKVANHHLLADTRADLFVSVFYGVLDAAAGTLTYCNAGHNPPYFIAAQNGDDVQALTKTGMVLGVLDDQAWERRTVPFNTDDLLVLYTDGVTDAENGQGEFFAEERLLKTVQSVFDRSTCEIRDHLMNDIQTFVGNAPQNDDITLMIVKR